MLKRLAQFITWPAITGILAAMMVIQWQIGDRNHLPSAPRQPVSFAGAVRQAAPAVVNIYTRKLIQTPRHPLADDPFFSRLLRNNVRRERYLRSLDSGVIVAPEGLILTNRHVIDGADEIVVLLQDGRNSLASVIGSDKHTDIAVLRIDLEDLTPISLGNPDQLQVGDVVLAIGNPYGFGNSVSQGIVSALGRYGLGLSTYEDYIQTDAAINQGNSGGALIDAEGRLVGINTAIYSKSGASVGIGLAIPSDLALQFMRDLVAYGKVIRGWMGLETQPLLGTDNRQTLRVMTTAEDGPAAKAGIRASDIITHINMQAVVDGRSTMQQIALLRPGNAIEITVLRQGVEINFQVVVGQRPE